MRRLAVLLMSFVCLSGSNLYAFSGGTGSSGDPYLVSTAAELNSIGSSTTYWASYFKLIANIDMSGYTGTSYNIIGSTSTHFTGGFNGNGYIISNLTYTGTGVSYVGMFGYTENAYIQNIQLTNINISSSNGSNIGGLIGYQYYGTTTINCYTSGSVSGGTAVGGLVGNQYGNSADIITNCYSTASVSGTSSRIGGLVGIASGTVRYSYSTGTVTSNSGTTAYIGGFIGDQYYAIVNECYATGTVNVSSTSWAVGGLTGNQNYSTMSNCYCTGTVNGGTGNFYVGGLIGWQSESTNTNCYSVGYINSSAGCGLIGHFYSGTITACFWDTTTSLKTDGVGNQDPDPSGAMGRTTAQMKMTSTVTSYCWDFATPVWVMPVEEFSYPLLASQSSDYGGGQGTSTYPWKIYTKAQLEYLGNHTADYDKYFILMADIDLAATTYTKPLIAADTDNVTGGFQGSAFKGNFNGNSHVISNITINAPDIDYVGLFGWVYPGATVRNLGVENVTVTGRLAAGGLAGATSGQLSDCHATGIVTGGDHYTGGLAGWNGSAVTRCYSTCEIEGYYYNGGLAGFNSSTGNISNSFTNSTTNGSSRTGGLVGRNEGTISGCYTLGATRGYCFFMPPSFYSDGYYVGGLCGENLGTISNSYARGVATRNGNGRLYTVGGLVGWNNQGKVIRSYSSGAPSGTSSVGGLVGAVTPGGNYENTGNFWDTDASGTTSSTMGTGKTTAQMKAQATFTAASWDFSTVWAICEGTNYPKLRWQTATPGNFICPDEVRMEDLAYMAKRWLRSNCASTSNCESADLNLSGAVNAADLLIFADNWLQ
ncbi:MAG: GLUG motif-containing protein [Anaerohalosphaeraceae bacterium]